MICLLNEQINQNGKQDLFNGRLLFLEQEPAKTCCSNITFAAYPVEAQLGLF